MLKMTMFHRLLGSLALGAAILAAVPTLAPASFAGTTKDPLLEQWQLRVDGELEISAHWGQVVTLTLRESPGRHTLPGCTAILTIKKNGLGSVGMVFPELNPDKNLPLVFRFRLPFGRGQAGDYSPIGGDTMKHGVKPEFWDLQFLGYRGNDGRKTKSNIVTIHLPRLGGTH